MLFSKRIIWIYGLSLALFVGLLKFMEYKYFLHQMSTEFYSGLLAVIFSGLGIWIGLRLVNKKSHIPEEKTKPILNIDEQKLKLGISSREYEVLTSIAAGNSNREVADKLCVSVATVKTHTGNLFAKLDVKSRTQAIVKAKALGLLT